MLPPDGWVVFAICDCICNYICNCICNWICIRRLMFDTTWWLGRVCKLSKTPPWSPLHYYFRTASANNLSSNRIFESSAKVIVTDLFGEGRNMKLTFQIGFIERSQQLGYKWEWRNQGMVMCNRKFCLVKFTFLGYFLKVFSGLL